MERRRRNRISDATPAKAREKMADLLRQIENVDALWTRLTEESRSEPASHGALSELEGQMRALYGPLTEIGRSIAAAEREAQRKRTSDRAIATLLARATAFYELRWDVEPDDLELVVTETALCRKTLKLEALHRDDVYAILGQSRTRARSHNPRTIAGTYLRCILNDFRGIERTLRRLSKKRQSKAQQ